jgi:hypothetical protein
MEINEIKFQNEIKDLLFYTGNNTFIKLSNQLESKKINALNANRTIIQLYKTKTKLINAVHNLTNLNISAFNLSIV